MVEQVEPGWTWQPPDGAAVLNVDAEMDCFSVIDQ